MAFQRQGITHCVASQSEGLDYSWFGSIAMERA